MKINSKIVHLPKMAKAITKSVSRKYAEDNAEKRGIYFLAVSYILRMI